MAQKSSRPWSQPTVFVISDGTECTAGGGPMTSWAETGGGNRYIRQVAIPHAIRRATPFNPAYVYILYDSPPGPS